jgi:HK97 family phage major capsid protein
MGKNLWTPARDSYDNFENWIYDEHSAVAIEKELQNSAVERLFRAEPMGAAVKTVPRDGGFTVGTVAKAAPYALSTSSNDNVSLTARKLGGAEAILDEDLHDPLVDVLAVKRRAATRALALFEDNACLGVTATTANGTTIPYVSLYGALSSNGDGSSVESSYSANDNVVTVTNANFIATLASGTGYDKINTWLAKYEESDYFDEANTYVIASDKFRSLLRGVKDAQGNPILVRWNTGIQAAPEYTVFGYQCVFSKGSRRSAVATQTPTGNPLMFIGNRNLAISGKASLAPGIPQGAPGFALQSSANGAGFLNDESYMKAAIRRGYVTGTRLAHAVLEITP